MTFALYYSQRKSKKVTVMSISDSIAAYIIKAMEQAEDGYAELQRNELAERIGCVPSQISYVLSSRFTPEQGYVVESRRGGSGYIRIRRVQYLPEVSPLTRPCVVSLRCGMTGSAAKAIAMRGLLSRGTPKVCMAR